MITGGGVDPDRRRSAGVLRWLFTAAAIFFLLVAYWQIRGIVRSDRVAAVGDGRNVASYRFDLSTCLVPRATLVASGMPRDTLAPLAMDRLLRPAQVDSLNDAERGKYLVPDDLVIGVVHAGVARAYPVRVLNWHEVANDTLGGRPIAVTWHPLCGSSAVLDRRVGNRELIFGQSGLLSNSNLLLYDRREIVAEVSGSGGGTNGESLWSQLQGRAVAGPAAERGDSLTVVPHRLTTWRLWRAAYPRTTVPLPEPSRRRSYAREPYGAYAGSDLLRFPVSPLPPTADHDYKEFIRAELGAGGWEVAFVTVGAEPVQASTAPQRPVIYAYWFAWYAAHPPVRNDESAHRPK